MIDPNDILGDANYEEILAEELPPRSIAFDEAGDGERHAGDSEEDIPLEVEAGIGGFEVPGTPIPAEQPLPADEHGDTSKLIKHRQNKFLDMSKFTKAVTTFAELTGMSRDEYKAFREVVHVLRDANGQVLPDVLALPKNLATLRDRMRTRMPLINMREANIPLKAEKLPTETERKKGKVRADDALIAVVNATLTFFDPPSVFKNIIASDIFTKMHHGLAYFVDEPRELFHSHAWASSIRTTSGQYAHIAPDMEASETHGAAVFPSDFVYFYCLDDGCYCKGIAEDSDDITDLHIGRVWGVGIDKRSDSLTFDAIVLQIHEGLRKGDPRLQNHNFDPPQENSELILASDIVYIPESCLFAYVDVYRDYAFGESHSNPTPAPSMRKARTTAQSRGRAPL